MKIGFATGFGPPVKLFSVVSPDTMNMLPLWSKFTVKKSPSRRSPPSKFVDALHVVPLRQILPLWIGRPDAFTTVNCGSTKCFSPSEHVTYEPCALVEYAA